MLYVANKHYSADRLATHLSRAGEASVVLFIEEAVYSVKVGSKTAEVIAGYLPRLEFYVLAPDLALRGIHLNDIVAGADAIDYDGFVELTVDNEVIQNLS